MPEFAVPTVQFGVGVRLTVSGGQVISLNLQKVRRQFGYVPEFTSSGPTRVQAPMAKPNEAWSA